MRRKTMACVLFNLLFSILISLLISSKNTKAKVTGLCVNCHTMHNSQNGTSMMFNSPYNNATGPLRALLRGTCLGCHGQNPSGTNYLINGIPQVLHAGSVDLPGGNFAYIVGIKTRASGDQYTVGHNVVDLGVIDAYLSSPPGDVYSTGVTNNNLTCAGKYGCHGDRSVSDPYLAIRGSHHADDSVLKFGSINLSGQGGTVGTSFRFLLGVKGGELRWDRYTTNETHNEYFGASSPGSGGSATSPAGNTISGFCAECHGYFHSTTGVGSSSPWIRHPSDRVLPNTYEYQYYTTYNITAPVARQATWSGWSGSGPSNTVTPGSDVIMCLSCHLAHAGPSYKILRWIYNDTGGVNGCGVCHTYKD
jgi:hypothetical protein